MEEPTPGPAPVVAPAPAPIAIEPIPAAAVPVPVPVTIKPTAEKPLNGEVPEKVPKPKRKWHKKAAKREGPKLPLSGYNFFMRQMRPAILEKMPDATIQDITRRVAHEWSSSTEEGKRMYLELAEQDKVRYHKEMSEFKLAKSSQQQDLAAAGNGDVEASAKPPKAAKVQSKIKAEVPQQVEKPVYLNGKPATNAVVPNGIDRPAPRTGDYDIPIFTDEFLEHNKAMDSELRVLRKSHTDYEQQNAILEKHVENMENGIEKLKTAEKDLMDTQKVLETYLERMRQRLVESFADHFDPSAIPTEAQGISMSNVDSYMAGLHTMARSNAHGPTLNKAKDVIRKADLLIPIQL